MIVAAAEMSHALLMDRIYRRQRHIYDLTRRYFLLGRDELIQTLAPPPGARVLELGCGTGRNLIAAAAAYPEARFYGADISAEMLESAEHACARAGLAERITLAAGDATRFDPNTAFRVDGFDRVFLSYTLSMIPAWRQALRQAAQLVAPGGELHVVDFGQQERLPAWFRFALFRWLALFHVTPRAGLRGELAIAARDMGARLTFESQYRGYAWAARLTRAG